MCLKNILRNFILNFLLDCMRKIVIIIIAICFCNAFAFGQSTYTMTNFAVSGDTFYLTKAQTSNTIFDNSGPNITWNYSSLAGISQRRLLYRLPTQAGFSAVQWPYLYNTNNVNLSSTDEQTVQFRSAFIIKQNMKGKPTPWKIKIYYLKIWAYSISSNASS